MKNERQLRDEIRLREASLEDARREHALGELSDEDFAAISERERLALGDAHHALEELDLVTPKDLTVAGVDATSRRRRKSRLVVALACFALAAVVLVWANVGLRQAGSSATGGLSLSQTEKLQQLITEGEADVAAGSDAAALSAYQQILTLQPTNVVALTEAGWLEASAGSKTRNATVVAKGVGLLHQAVTLAPTSPAPRLYYAIVAYETPGNRALATAQFRDFISLRPSKAQLAVAAPFLRLLGITP
ncbi:MAG: hypothetical protein HIU57_09140 [Acidobacteria bacterium]|nr:hypothetical protein [Acidobacteriota bacterium]